MKKLLAITLLSIHLFNLVGYPFLFRVLIIQSGKHLSEQIDHHKYLDTELIELKVALNAPYINTWGNYERYDGEITVNGVHHNYVKRKVSGDTLYLMCVPNKETNQLYAAKNEYSQKINDLPGGKKEGQETVKKGSLLNQYQEQVILYSFSLSPAATTTHNHSLILPLPTSFIEMHGKPPEMKS